MTVPDPHAPSSSGAPLSRRAAREARERAAFTGRVSLAPGHPPIFKPPPPPIAGLAGLAPVVAPRAVRMPARHVRRSRGRAVAAFFGAAAGAALILSGTAVATSALSGSIAPEKVVEASGSQASSGQESARPLPEVRAATSGAGAPEKASDASALVVPAGSELCATPAFTTALARHDDAAAITAAGGAAAFRTAVAAGTAPCVSLADPADVWVVVNKLRPFAPVDFAPSPLGLPAGVRSLEGGMLRTDAAAALSRMAAAAKTAGVGEIALESGYRSYRTQVTSYGDQVSAKGADEADLVSARPGFSEHQSGLAGDVVACDGGCGTLDDLAGSAQGVWLTAHAWEYGWVVRYEGGQTAVSGYLPEPWHLRYIGTELAAAYHDGGFHTLEAFFGLPAAPDYAD